MYLGISTRRDLLISGVYFCIRGHLDAKFIGWGKKDEKRKVEKTLKIHVSCPSFIFHSSGRDRSNQRTIPSCRQGSQLSEMIFWTFLAYLEAEIIKFFAQKTKVIAPLKVCLPTLIQNISASRYSRKDLNINIESWDSCLHDGKVD